MKKGKLILVSGGARSGKSTFAEEYVLHEDKHVGYLATAEALDKEMMERIEKHKMRRPSSWKTFEEPLKPAQIIAENYQECHVWLMDCITLYVSNMLFKYMDEDMILKEIEKLIETIRVTGITMVAVTNEVGWGLVPPDSISRAYRDIAGRVNQKLASCADEVYLVTMGIPLKIKPQGDYKVEL